MVRVEVRNFFVRHGVKPSHIVLAASGGVDSSALLLAMADLRTEGFSVTCAHINHHLRGADSDEDERFLRRLCETLHVPIDVRDGTVDPAEVRRSGVEAAARNVRFRLLEQIRIAAGADWIATAHQKNDQAETVLMRLLTGGGLGALRGIRPLRDDRILRPLLDVSRHQIEDFLRERGVTPRIDRSNLDPRFLRNRVRRLLSEFDPAAIDNLASLAYQAQLLWPAVERLIDEAEAASSVSSRDQTRFDSWPDDLWMRQALLHRHILRLDPAARDVSSADLLRIATGLRAIRRLSVTRELELVRKGTSLLLRRRPRAAGEFEIEVGPGRTAFLPSIGESIRIEAAARGGAPASPDRRRQRLQLPPGAEASFVVRNRRAGDRFQPLGLSAPKKLKDFFIDRKIAAEDRDRVPLLIWNGEIVWVGGVEVSERFKITDSPGDVYEVRLERAGAFREADEGQTSLHREADREADRGARKADPEGCG
ncbi:MAG TPA: tRNA lysidine(34) synthetase TilS [Thermoanaerobaculia bacterium]|nr:tRNA lysidine(34) synthetase TilS [Thermoanaerobaculia bacterium]